MKAERLCNVFGLIDERYILEAAPGREHSPRNSRKLSFFRKPGGLAAVLALVLLLAVPVRAELANGYVSNLLAPLYGGAQTALVDRIGVPVAASVTVGDYRLSADAVIGDKYNVAIVYSLSRTDGEPLEEGLGFETFESTVKRGTGGGSYRFHLDPEKTTLSITQRWTSSRHLRLNRRVTSVFTDLVRFDPETQEKELVQEGKWELAFSLRYEDSSETVFFGKTQVKDDAGGTYTVRRILLSPIGIHLDMTGPNHTRKIPGDKTPYKDFYVSLMLTDGTVIKIEDRNISSSGKLEAETHKIKMGALFETPLPLEKIQAVVVCGTAFPVSQ